MNRKEFQNWLNQFPEDTIIEVAIQDEPGFGAYGGVDFYKFEPSAANHYELLDFRGNRFVKNTEPHYEKVFLRLGYGS